MEFEITHLTTPLIGGIIGYITLGGDIVDKFLGMLHEPTEHFLANQINKMLRDNCEVIVGDMVEQEVNSFVWFGALLGLAIGCINLYV